MKRKHRILGLSIFIVLLTTLFIYIRWINIPSGVINEIYDIGYTGIDPETIHFSSLIQHYKDEQYSRPHVRWKYSNKTWEVVSDYYLYSKQDGSVTNVNVVFTTFKIDSVTRFIFMPKLARDLDFIEVRIINGINDK